MRLSQIALTWGMAAVSTLALVLPARADRFWDIGDHHGGIGIGIGIGVSTSSVKFVQEDPKDEAVVFHQWYAEQLRGYTDVDMETGERICDVAQIVTDVFDRYVIVVDETNLRNNVFVNDRTKVIFSGDNVVKPIGPNGAPMLPSLLRPGDVVVANGHLRPHGGLMAHSLRVVGHCRWYGEADTAAAQPAWGYRVWGTVNTVDGAGGALEIKVNDGARRFVLDRDGAVWSQGKQATLDYLRAGDRVVIYCHNRTFDNDPLAFRIVLLHDNDVYPDGDKPCWSDPDGAVVVENGPMLEGDVEFISTGVFFDTVYIRTHDGHHEHFRCPHGASFYDAHGHHVAPHDLRVGSGLRVHYSDVSGNHFAHRVEVK